MQAGEYKPTPLSSLNHDQINELAQLHLRAMRSLLSELGLPFIERYYQTACADTSVIGVCVLGPDGNPLGWTIGSADPNRLNRRVREAWGWFLIQMMILIVTRPSIIPRIIASMKPASIKMKAGAVELTYLGVDESARRQGVGGSLLNAFIASARKRKFTSVELSVETGNTDAIALYTRAGFRIIASYKEGAFDRHRMELKLE